MADWSAGHGPLSGTINAATGLMATSSVAAVYNVQPGWPVLASGVMAIGGTIGGLAREDHEKLTRGALVFRATSWLSAGGWMSYALTYDNPINPTTVGLLAGIAAFMGTLGSRLATKRRKKAEREAEVAKYLDRVGRAHEWASRIDRVCKLQGTRVIAVDDKDWPDGSGFTLEVELPMGGFTWNNIKAYSDGLASDARLPEGCGVEVGPGVDRGSAILKVSLINALDGVHNVPLDVTPLDFNSEFDIGKHRDSSMALINMREWSGMLVGEKGAGKTNQLRAMITRFLRMPNLLIWIIDYNSGSLALPIMKAWDDAGRPGRPPIDWVASDDEEALLMTKAAVAIAQHRKIVYQDLMYKANTDLLPMTAEIPGIMIISDEGAEFLGTQTKTGAENIMKRKIADHYTETLRIARSVGVNELTCGLRATTDVFGDSMIKSQSKIRIGLMMQNADEIAYLFGWDAKVSPQDMPDQGYGAYANGSGVVQMFKGYRVLPEHLKTITVGTANLRPVLDGESVGAAGEAYTQRWSRAVWLDAMKLKPITTTDTPAAGSGGTMTLTKPPAVAVEDEEPPQTGTELWSPDAVQQEVEQEMSRGGGDNSMPGVPDNYREVFDQMMAAEGWGDNPAASDPEPNDETTEDAGDFDFKAIVFGVVKASGADGIKPADIHRSLAKAFPDRTVPVVKTITRWLQADDRIYQPSFGHYAVRPKPGSRG